MATPGSVIVKILGDATSATKAMDETGDKGDTLGSKMGAVGKVVAGALTGAALIDFGKNAVEAFDASAQASSALDLALKNNSSTAGVNAAAFDKLNEALAKHAIASPAVISAAEAQMATFGESKAQIQSMIPTVLDLAAKLGIDAPAAADTMDKAALGSTKALKALGIDGYKPTGDKAKDLANIQAMLTDKTKGAAQAQLDAAGPGVKIKKSMEELEVSVGSLLVPTLKKLSDILSGVIDWFTNMPGPMKDVVGVVAALAGAVFVVIEAQKAWTAVQAAFNIVMDANPLILVALAIAGLVAGIILAYQHVEWFRDIVQTAFGAVSDVITGVWNWVKSNWPLLLGILTGPIGLAVVAITTHWDDIKAGFTAVKDWISARIDDIVGFFTGMPGRLAKVASGLFDFVKDSFKTAINWVIGQWNDFKIPGIKILGHEVSPEINFPDIPTLGAGGPINGLALVGDKGPELFAGVGTIIPNHALGGTTVNVTVSARVDAGIDMGTAGVAITRMINDGISAGLDSVARKVTAGV